MSKKPDDSPFASAIPCSGMLWARARLYECIRQFFGERGYLEVQTPLRVPAPALEDHIDALPADGKFLRTSPELHMKRLLASGHERVFQLGPCFRRGESGPRHLPEFTMLEWYRTAACAADLLDETADLLRATAERVAESPVLTFNECRIRVDQGVESLRVAEAFASFAKGRSVEQALAAGEFERVLADHIEKHLGRERPLALTRYPAEMAALARLCADDPSCAERWELYLGGMEIANAFTELTDACEQRQRFEATAEYRRRNGRAVYPMDQAFLEALEAGLPDCAGIALGVDRLLMVLAGAESIQEVVPFSEDIV